MKKIILLLSFVFCLILTSCNSNDLNSLKIEIELNNKKQESLVQGFEMNKASIEDFNIYLNQCFTDFNNIDSYYVKMEPYISYYRNLKDSLIFIDETRSQILYENALAYSENFVGMGYYDDIEYVVPSEYIEEDEEMEGFYLNSVSQVNEVSNQISLSDYLGYKNTEISIYPMINTDTGYTEELVIIKDEYSQYLLTLIWDKGKVIEFYYE